MCLSTHVPLLNFPFLSATSSTWVQHHSQGNLDVQRPCYNLYVPAVNQGGSSFGQRCASAFPFLKGGWICKQLVSDGEVPCQDQLCKWGSNSCLLQSISMSNKGTGSQSFHFDKVSTTCCQNPAYCGCTVFTVPCCNMVVPYKVPTIGYDANLYRISPRSPAEIRYWTEVKKVSIGTEHYLLHRGEYFHC